MSSSPLTIVAITTAPPGKEAVLGAAQEKLVDETLIEDGCLRYELHQSLSGNATPWTPHVVRDREVITGQNPASASQMGLEVLKRLK